MIRKNEFLFNKKKTLDNFISEAIGLIWRSLAHANIKI